MLLGHGPIYGDDASIQFAAVQLFDGRGRLGDALELDKAAAYAFPVRLGQNLDLSHCPHAGKMCIHLKTNKVKTLLNAAMGHC